MDLGVLVGKFREEVSRRISKKEDVESWLVDNYHLDPQGARSIATCSVPLLVLVKIRVVRCCLIRSVRIEYILQGHSDYDLR